MELRYGYVAMIPIKRTESSRALSLFQPAGEQRGTHPEEVKRLMAFKLPIDTCVHLGAKDRGGKEKRIRIRGVEPRAAA